MSGEKYAMFRAGRSAKECQCTDIVKPTARRCMRFEKKSVLANCAVQSIRL